VDDPCLTDATTRRSARVVIVGGGYTGASVGVELARTSAIPLDVTVVEPRAELGRGLAYSSDDPDNRLNATIATHLVDPADPGALGRWCAETRLLARDPDARAANGGLFIRRSDFGAFVARTVRELAQAASGSTIRHVQDRVVDVALDGGIACVHAQSGSRLRADLVVIATGNAPARLPRELAPPLAASRAVIADPADIGRVRALPRDARVLVLGAGLTALDVVSTLLRNGHAGAIDVVSRRGLRPRGHAPTPNGNDEDRGRAVLARIEGPLPAFVTEQGALTVRGLLRALRRRVGERQRDGGDWREPFDELRDVVWRVWPSLPLAQKRRFLHRLRPWYDAHRFRAPPQNDAMVRAAERCGLVRFRIARLQAVTADPSGGVRVAWRATGGSEAREATYDALVNCTGLDPGSGTETNPVLAALVQRGLATPDATGIGLAVDAACRPLDARGNAVDALRVFGPPTAGTFGDPLGAVFIAAQIRRALDAMQRTLARAQGESPR
jgi:uncharacterized NAD(P)/FAD-binding protein YdhS